MKRKVYLDTSIPSAYYDFSKPMRQHITQKWFENESRNYEIYVSTLVIEEINKLGNIEKRENILDLIQDYNSIILDQNNIAEELAMKYMENGAIPESELEDALRIAIATINKIESLASWNFRHIVSINPIRKVHEINLGNNYSLIEMGSLEIFGGHKYGNV